MMAGLNKAQASTSASVVTCRRPAPLTYFLVGDLIDDVALVLAVGPVDTQTI